MGRIKYEECEADDFGASIKDEWFKQFNKDIIRPTEVSKKIVASQDADWNFMVNLIVLFCNTMGSCKYNGTCDLHVLSRLTKETNFQEINWCKYIISRLRNCKNNWSGRNENEFFCGPMTTLVVSFIDI